MNAALETLFYTFETDLLSRPEAQQKVLFLNAQYHAGLSHFPQKSLTLQQYFKPYAAVLEARGYNVCSAFTFENEGSDMAFICLPKNKVEALFWIASALKALKRNGVLICAAENKAGGTRIQSMLQGFGLDNLSSVSKHKARAVWTRKETINEAALAKALRDGEVQKILGGEYLSQPGVFGWDKIDKGSSVLLQHIVNDLKGVGADFGCGYGLLSRHIIQQCMAVKQFYAIDADWRAAEVCKKNTGVEVLWEDITSSKVLPKNLDFIVMNPPFHEGKKADSDIGAAFIQTAYECLKRNGVLWMVANNQLPYEDVLRKNFFETHKIFEGQGFKVYKAVK